MSLKDDETRGVDVAQLATFDMKSTLAPTVLGGIILTATTRLAPELGVSPILFAFGLSALISAIVLVSNQGPLGRLLMWPVMTLVVFNATSGVNSLRQTDIPAAVTQSAEQVSRLIEPAVAVAQEPTPKPWGNPW